MKILDDHYRGRFTALPNHMTNDIEQSRAPRLRVEARRRMIVFGNTKKIVQQGKIGLECLSESRQLLRDC